MTIGGAGADALLEAQCDRAVSTPAAKSLEPLEAFSLGVMPTEETDLLDGEKQAYAALRAAKNAQAREEDTAAYHIAQNRSLCELVRRVPTTAAELLISACV